MVISGFPDGSFLREMTRAQVVRCWLRCWRLKIIQVSRAPVTVPSKLPLVTSFSLSTNSIFKSGFSEVPVTSLSVSNDVLTVNARYVYALDRTTGNPDVVIGNTRYAISRMVVNGDKLVVYPVSRYIYSLQLDSYKYNADYLKLYINGKDDGFYLADMTIVDEYTVEVRKKL